MIARVHFFDFTCKELTMPTEVTARVAILLDVTLTESFDRDRTASSIFAAAESRAKELVQTMIDQYGGAGGKAKMTCCNEPKVCLVIAAK